MFLISQPSSVFMGRIKQPIQHDIFMKPINSQALSQLSLLIAY